VYVGSASAAPTHLTATPGSVTAGQAIVAGTAIDAQHAWVATQPTSATGNVTIDSTVNGGVSWQQSTVSASETTGGPSIEFSNASDGFLVVPMGGATPGSTSVLFQPTDGGQTWSEVSSSVPVGPVSQTSATTLWGDAASGGNLLFESTNAGASWQQVTLPAAPSALAGWTGTASVESSSCPTAASTSPSCTYTTSIIATSDDGAQWVPAGSGQTTTSPFSP
jgi:photosystem II stability/assembly factor-like uncharacterized protein